MSGLTVIFGTILLAICETALAQTFCAKYDFNRTTNPEFRVCSGRNLEGFVNQDYASHPEIRPYRPTSRYFLTNSFVQAFLCIESSAIFSFKQNTTVDAAIFLKSIGNSFLQIDIYDADRNFLVHSFRSDGTVGWTILHGIIRNNIPRGRVIIILQFSKCTKF